MVRHVYRQPYLFCSARGWDLLPLVEVGGRSTIFDRGAGEPSREKNPLPNPDEGAEHVLIGCVIRLKLPHFGRFSSFHLMGWTGADMGTTHLFSIRFNTVSESFDSDTTHDSPWLSKNWFKSTHDSNGFPEFRLKSTSDSNTFQKVDSDQLTTKKNFQNLFDSRLKQTFWNIDSNQILT